MAIVPFVVQADVVLSNQGRIIFVIPEVLNRESSVS